MKARREIVSVVDYDVAGALENELAARCRDDIDGYVEGKRRVCAHLAPSHVSDMIRAKPPSFGGEQRSNVKRIRPPRRSSIS